MKGDKTGNRRKYIENLSDAKKDSVSKMARDSLAVETLGELAVYSAALPYQSFVAVTLSKIMYLMGAATGSVFRYDAATKTALITLWQGMEASDVGMFAKQSVAEGVPGLAANCILKRSPILVENPLTDANLATTYFRETLKKYNLTSAIALPLIKESRVFGAMVLFTSGENKFDENDVAFLRAVSLPIVSAFEAQEHVDEINRERAKLWKILESLAIGVLFLDEKGIVVNSNKTALSMMRVEEGMVAGKSVEETLFPHLLNAKSSQAYPRFADIRHDVTEEVTYIAPSYNRKSPVPPVIWNAKFSAIDGVTVFVFSDTCRERGFFASQAALAEAAVKYVRQPVRNLMESMSMVAIAGDLNSRQYDNLSKAQGLAEKMWHNLRLVEKSVEYATGKLMPSKDAVNIDDVIKKACARCSDAAMAKGIAVSTSAAGGGVLYGDSIMIGETIDVVLSEVVDAARAGSNLRISAGYSKGRLKVDVSSDKPSMPGISNPLAMQYLRNFFAYIKGDIDFNPAAEKNAATPVVSFSIPS